MRGGGGACLQERVWFKSAQLFRVFPCERRFYLENREE